MVIIGAFSAAFGKPVFRSRLHVRDKVECPKEIRSGRSIGAPGYRFADRDVIMQRRVNHIRHRDVLVGGQTLQLIYQIVRKRNALHHSLIIAKNCAGVTTWIPYSAALPK